MRSFMDSYIGPFVACFVLGFLVVILFSAIDSEIVSSSNEQVVFYYYESVNSKDQLVTTEVPVVFMGWGLDTYVEKDKYRGSVTPIVQTKAIIKLEDGSVRMVNMSSIKFKE